MPFCCSRVRANSDTENAVPPLVNISASEVVFHEEALYQVYLPLPLPLGRSLTQLFYAPPYRVGRIDGRCLSVRPSVCAVSDPKSRTEGRWKLIIGKKEVHMTPLTRDPI